jgi:stage II sporulation SpoE-like protein
MGRKWFSAPLATIPPIKPLEVNQEIAGLERRTDLQRKADFLRSINRGLIALHLAALLIMLIPPLSAWYSFAILGSSLLANLIVFYLNRHGFIQVAARLFCYSFDVVIFVFFLINFTLTKEILSAVLFGYFLALSVLLAGLLIDTRATFWFAALNTGLILTTFLIVSDTLGTALRNGFPIIAFLNLIALVSWLYQRSLSRADARLSAARERIMQNELMRRDMAIARDLQRHLYPAPPLVGDELEIASRSEPARETSGDFYDFIELGPDTLGLVIADVTGKSLAAALVMAMTRSTLRGEARRSASPSEVLYQANQILCGDTSVKQLITAFYGILNTRTLVLRCANAGHLFPTLKRAGRIEEIELCGLPLGARPGTRYDEQTVQLQSGDQLILISDGIVEAMNTDRELFGFERLAETFQRTDAASSQQILQTIWQAVETFRGTIEQQDDITLIAIKVGSPQPYPLAVPVAVAAASP